MVISSLVVETLPQAASAVAEQLLEVEGVEVHEMVDGYKIVVTIEADTVDASHDIANGFVALKDVIGVNLVYLNFEDDKTIFPDGA